MAGLTCSITWEGEDLRKAQRGLALLSRAGAWMPAILGSIGEAVRQHTDDRWRKELDPSGQPWKPLTKPYAKWKAKQPGAIQKTLQFTGRLRNSIAWQLVGDDAVAVGTPLEYAAPHQNPQKPNQLRPFLGIDRADRVSMGRIIAKNIRAVLNAT